jgi:threonine aldolase
MIDLRSDTVTCPSDAMRKVMAEAEVGDDVYREDATVRKLEERAAEMAGKEAGLFLTSGTMGNLVALLTHAHKGTSVLLGRQSHIACSEGGGVAMLAHMMPYVVDDAEGLPDMAALKDAFRDEGDVHIAPTRLVCLENTHNRQGGIASSFEDMKLRTEWAKSKGASVHLDGARIFNATAALGEKAARFCSLADSVQICLSKGLGAPVGSVLCGRRDFIETARLWRKKVGGGMRQAGIIAAGGLYALEHNVERLAEDHENARLLKTLLDEGGVSVRHVKNPTNMVYFKIDDDLKVREFLDSCRAEGLFFSVMGHADFRMVTHLNVSKEQVRKAAEILLKVKERLQF